MTVPPPGRRDGQAKQEREQAQQWVAAQRAKKRQEAERKRKVEQVERDLARRQAAREKEAEQKEKERARRVQQAARLAKLEQVEQLKAEALERTSEVQAREAALRRVLVDRSPGLRDHRVAVEQALAGGATAFVEAVEGALAGCEYPAGLRRAWRLAYAPESRELMVDVDLPGQDVIPSATGYRYKATDPPAVVPQPRKEAESKELYKQLVARLALRAVDEVLAVTPPALVASVAFNGHVQAKDRATGKAVRPCLVSVRTERDTFDELVLDEPELDPVLCLRHLNAIVSQHPYDLEPVRPVVTFDLSKYKFIDEIDVVAGLDSRPDLVALDPTEFEHLVRRLFEAIGLKAWVTQASRDDGIDAVAANEDPIIGGLCIIQAKRYKNVVPAEAVRSHEQSQTDRVPMGKQAHEAPGGLVALGRQPIYQELHLLIRPTRTTTWQVDLDSPARLSRRISGAGQHSRPEPVRRQQTCPRPERVLMPARGMGGEASGLRTPKRLSAAASFMSGFHTLIRTDVRLPLEEDP
ncbi:restriction endonuclease [Actinacidiphila glaucinigra]|uniref:restriction endonuclease n=1 Tax=Actinacidiphila glaucinigra TaxID=235986 RepID=UPI00368ED9FE